MLIITMGVIGLGFLVLSRARKRRGGEGDATSDLAGFSL
jgi:hypothetical protein